MRKNKLERCYDQEKDYTDNCSQDFKFTGKERDPETGLDNFGARYYASSFARFMSPDPGHAGAVLDNPQSWDAYSYVMDNPETLTDPSGTAACGSNPKDVSQCNEAGLVKAWMLLDNPFYHPSTAQQRSTALPLRDSRGKVVLGASGNPALVPSNFDVSAVINAGMRDLVLRAVLPAVGDAATLNDLAKFRRGGSWDLQRLGGTFDKRYIDSATILIGMYTAASGLSRNRILSIENTEAARHYAKGTPMDPTYTHLPERNVANTDIGMRLVFSGAIQ